MPANPTPAEGVVVPIYPTEAMLDAAHGVPVMTFEGKPVYTTSREAEAIYLAMLAARPSAPTQSAAQTGEVDSAKACGDRMVRVADALMPWLKNYPPSTRRERAIEAANAAISAALSQPEQSQ